MGRPLISIHTRTAAEGLKAEIMISPSLWRELVEHGGDWEFTDDEAVLDFTVHDLRGSASRRLEFRLAKLTVRMAGDEWPDDLEEPPEYDDDESDLFPR